MPAYQTLSLLSYENLALLHPPDPRRQCAIDNEIRYHSPQRSRLGSVPSELVVCVESYRGDGYSGITEGKADVG